MRHAMKEVSGNFIPPLMEATKEDGMVKLDIGGHPVFLSPHAFKQIRFVLTHHIELVQAMLNNFAYEDVLEALQDAAKDMR